MPLLLVMLAYASGVMAGQASTVTGEHALPMFLLSCVLVVASVLVALQWDKKHVAVVDKAAAHLAESKINIAQSQYNLDKAQVMREATDAALAKTQELLLEMKSLPNKNDPGV